MRAKPAADMYLAVLSMLPSVRRRLDALEVVARSLRARAIRATPAENVHHAVLSMLPAEHRRLAALNIKIRLRSAEFV